MSGLFEKYDLKSRCLVREPVYPAAVLGFDGHSWDKNDMNRSDSESTTGRKRWSIEVPGALRKQ